MKKEKEIIPHQGRTLQKWNDRYELECMKRYLPPRIVKDLQNFKNIKVPELMGHQSLYLHGANRTGKTLTAAKILINVIKKNYLLAQPYNSYFVKMPDLLQEIKNSFGKYDIDVLEKYLKCEMLILDDFGTNKPSDWVYEVLYRLVDTRYEQMLPIIFTSNISVNELRDLYKDTRIASRISRMGTIIEKERY